MFSEKRGIDLTPDVCSPSAWSFSDADRALQQLQQATLERESKLTARSAETAAILVKYAADLGTLDGRIARIEADLEAFYEAKRAEFEKDGKKSIQLPFGAIGMRAPANPALIPLSESWSWEKIAKKLKFLFKLKYFHPPKPPAIDKVKVKKELSVEEMAKCGLKLDTTETFFIDLNGLKTAERKAA